MRFFLFASCPEPLTSPSRARAAHPLVAPSAGSTTATASAVCRQRAASYAGEPVSALSTGLHRILVAIDVSTSASALLIRFQSAIFDFRSSCRLLLRSSGLSAVKDRSTSFTSLLQPYLLGKAANGLVQQNE